MNFKSFKTIHQPNKVEGTIALICSDLARYSVFTGNFARLAQQHPNVKIEVSIGLQIARSRNLLMDRIEGDWVWWMDDDHSFEPNLLTKLLSWNEDIVGPLYVMRRIPPLPTARVVRIVDGKKDYGIPTGVWSKPPGLYEVDTLGTSGLLVRRHVWEKIEKPYFITGHVEPDLLSEDMYFSEKAKEAGFKLFLDTTSILGHLTSMTMAPNYRDGKWYCDLHMNHGTTSIDCVEANVKAGALTA